MIGFFIKSGGEEADAKFSPFIWGDGGFGDYLDKFFAKRSYGKNIEFVLIMFYVEGHFQINLPKKIKPSYSAKERGLSVEVPVLKAFFTKSEKERCHFIVESIVMSVNSTRKLCERNQLDLDVDSLVRDVEGAGKRWIEARQLPAATN